MVGINNIVLVGRLSKDPEARAFQNKRYTVFTLAVERPSTDKNKKGKVDFIPCTCWNEKMAAFIANKAAKGALCGVIGRLSYEVKKLENSYRIDASVIVNNVFLYEYKKEDNMPVNTSSLPDYSDSESYNGDGRLDPDADLPF